MQTAKLFKNGRSQAVRLPKEFRFEGDEVYVKRDGNSVVLIPKEKPKENPWTDFFAALDMYDPAFPIERHQPREQRIRKSLAQNSGLRGEPIACQLPNGSEGQALVTALPIVGEERVRSERQAALVTPHQDGPHAQTCARLLKEIDNGRDTLLKPAKRKAYDAQLAKLAAPTQATRPAAGLTLAPP